MRKYSILIIDDEVEVIRTILDILENENPNYTFYKTAEPKLALRIAESRKPDLIVTDWDMPEMSGIELIKKLKNNTKTSVIPVIMLTGVMTRPEHLKTALEAGAIDYIRKPIDEIELTARIKSMLVLADSHKELVSLKDRQLASVSLSISKKNRLNLQVIDKLNSIKDRLSKEDKIMRSEITQLIQTISEETRGDSWMSFKTYFNNVHPTFFNHLLDLCPDLSPAEIKLAAFLRLNLTSKEIASIILIAPESVKTARNRLRKKLNLAQEENINRFLISL